ncbi:hypothetical protein GRI34_01945 [Erythrobacter aquimaris]|uniref:Uncharacterized protein n=1 Tax=Qipengyuania aquimaris TaxID=255984 RepID=A0A6I4TKT1_9SPHN|nr:hypothetical protein [Qipengyuania aquimaris]MXO95178.1 hypothetical protein [Qipengyuania aquimaris]
MLGLFDVFDVYEGNTKIRARRRGRILRLIGFAVIALLFVLTIRTLW